MRLSLILQVASMVVDGSFSNHCNSFTVGVPTPVTCKPIADDEVFDRNFPISETITRVELVKALKKLSKEFERVEKTT